MGRSCFRVMAYIVAVLLLFGCVTVAVHAEPAMDWSVYSMEENENRVPVFKTPPAYEYTDRGLRVTPAEGMESYTVQYGRACSPDEGFFMELTVENVSMGNMLFLHVWDQSGMTVGNLHCGSGWYCIISLDKNGNDFMMSVRLWETTDSVKGGSEILGTMSVKTAVSDDAGTYSLAVADGVLRLNGTAVPGWEEALRFLKEKSPNGEVYVGATLMGAEAVMSLSSMTVTRFGRNEATATIVGTDVIPETTPPSAETKPAEPDSGASSDSRPADTAEPADPQPTDTAEPADPTDPSAPEATAKPEDPEQSRPDGTGGGESRPAETDEFGNYREPEESETLSTADRLADVYGEAVSACHASFGAGGAVCVAIMGAAFLLLRKKH